MRVGNMLHRWLLTTSFFIGLLLIPTFVFAEELDSDSDGLSDAEEMRLGSNPFSTDTDGDGYADAEEFFFGFSSTSVTTTPLTILDTDGDKLTDAQEIRIGTSVVLKDTDGDGHEDYAEMMRGFSPVSVSTSSVDRLPQGLFVDLTTQTMTYRVGGEILHTFPVSTGNPGTLTPTGTFAIMRKIENKRYVGPGYNLPNVLWNMEFKTGGYYIHSAYWHNDFGKRTHSHGCINMRIPDAKLLFEYLDPGVPVVVSGVTPKRRTVGT